MANHAISVYPERLPSLAVLAVAFVTTLAVFWSAKSFADQSCIGNAAACGGFVTKIQGSFGGVGYAAIGGKIQEGEAWVTKDGYVDVENKSTLGGNSCGPTCPQGKFKMEGAAGERVNAGGFAIGQEVLIENAGAAEAILDLQWGKNPTEEAD